MIILNGLANVVLGSTQEISTTGYLIVKTAYQKKSPEGSLPSLNEWSNSLGWLGLIMILLSLFLVINHYSKKTK
ncbi:hypothetical protein RV11_GL000748 [Enterococcus phoeniculicola]|jgi:hypothetical protein|uniref:Uncharacterized protein n=1 Tax=Enterococcus phoeniculicola ATCC BAA-412 TaxID=1158610 RepID=R3TVQ0_9ENTE|nr:hypothetical protein [Enterococcus phoeniculicola]EOL45233.1 hypothetical protein UC3_01123 [Enterococcus phoeniculicola ATCC BAA-412]EOT74595.1 hypothetical protein I589_02195 [Enterococcus phoeniculicola ATCC BAA-412]OJG70864.1 hypothetical protein RV11_GL000748 [Enterococcus phoeniculicola]